MTLYEFWASDLFKAEESGEENKDSKEKEYLFDEFRHEEINYRLSCWLEEPNQAHGDLRDVVLSRLSRSSNPCNKLDSYNSDDLIPVLTTDLFNLCKRGIGKGSTFGLLWHHDSTLQDISDTEVADRR